MIYTKEQIDSSIVMNQDLWLYKITLPWIKRYFESIYYSYDGFNKDFWHLVNKFFRTNKIDLHNKLVWITRFNNSYIICFIDLITFESKYFFSKSFDIFEINLEWKIYNIFIYEDLKNKIHQYSEYSGADYNFSVNDKLFIVKNAKFNTEVLYELFKLDNTLEDKEIKILDDEVDNFLDIADIFIFDDYFIETNNEHFENFYKLFETFNNKVLKINFDLYIKVNITKYTEKYYPKLKINFSILTENKDEFKIDIFRDLLLSFFPENSSCYLINNKNIENYFSNEFNDFTNLEFDKLKLNFKLPDSIYSSDKLYEKFKLDILKLRYNFFLLKEVYKVKNNKVIENCVYLKLFNNRVDLNKENLKLTIIKYEDLLLKVLNNVDKLVDFYNKQK